MKNHTQEEQMQVKKKSQEESVFSNINLKKMLDPSRQKAIKVEQCYNVKTDHTYSNLAQKSVTVSRYVSMSVKQDLKNKIEKNRIKKVLF